MALVELTGSVAAWAKGLVEGLTRWGFDEAAASFSSGPPFPATDVSAADYDRLAEYLEAGTGVLRELLDADEPEPPAS
jgi:hypothetical protein